MIDTTQLTLSYPETEKYILRYPKIEKNPYIPKAEKQIMIEIRDQLIKENLLEELSYQCNTTSQEIKKIACSYQLTKEGKEYLIDLTINK